MLARVEPSMRRAARAALALLAAAAGPLRAQSAGACTGADVAGDRVGPGIAVVYAIEHCPAGDRLAVVALWRGQQAWGGTALGDSLAARAVERRLQARQDSLQRAGAGLGGGSDARRFWALVFDRPARQAAAVIGDARRDTTLDSYALGPTDSVLVVLVDRVDGVGGPPYVAATARIAPAGPAGLVPSAADHARMRQGAPPRDWDVAGTVRRLLAPVPAAHSFLR